MSKLMDMQLGNLSNLNLLWVVAAVVGVMVLAVVLRRRALARFATTNLLGRLKTAGSSARQVIRIALVATALVALVLALLDIRWGKVWRDVPQKGIQVMLVLDVSRSMLAEDATPNRLQRAKQQIADMVDAMAGDRVGLVGFAGDARQLVPLTSHYHDFKQTLSEVGPQDIDRGGSRLGNALKLAADGFLDQTGDHKAIVVFTDGEDQESEPVRTAEQLYRDRGIRVFTVGLGDMDQGARIPVQQAGRGRSYMEYHGQQVWSKLNGGVLKQVALGSDGAYIPAGTKQVDMARVYQNYVAQIEQQDFETARINSYVPRYQWFVGLALLLLTLDTLLPTVAGHKNRSRTRRGLENVGVEKNLSRATSTTGFRTASDKKTTDKSSLPTRKVTAAAGLAMVLLVPQAAFTAEPASLVRQANRALRAGDIEQALADYRRAAESDPNRPELLYNQAVAQYRNGQYEQARQLFAQTAATADEQLHAKARYNLANCDYAEAVQLAEKDKPAAIEHLQSAISHYRAALAANAADSDARVNAQLAQMLIDRLQREEEEQEQDQDQEQEQDQSDQKDEKDEKDEQAQSKENQDNQKQGQQDQENKEQESGNNQQQNEEQESRDNQQPSQDKPSAQQADKPQQQDQGEKPQSPAPGSPPPEDSPQQPETGPASGTPQFGHDDASLAADSRPMTKEEAHKMLQAVRDRELMRRLMQQQQSQRQRVPVDRDW